MVWLQTGEVVLAAEGSLVEEGEALETIEHNVDRGHA